MTGPGGRDVEHLLGDLREQLSAIQAVDGWSATYASAALRLVDQLAEQLPAVVGPAGGVLRVRADQVLVRDRLVADLMVGRVFADRPEVTAVATLGPLLVLELGDSARDWAISAENPVLVDRPAPPLPVTVEEAIAATAAAAESEEVDETPAVEPRPGQPDPAVSLGRVARLLDPVDPAGGPVADRERGRLWLPPSPRAWAGRFVREAGR